MRWYRNISAERDCVSDVKAKVKATRSQKLAQDYVTSDQEMRSNVSHEATL